MARRVCAFFYHLPRLTENNLRYRMEIQTIPGRWWKKDSLAWTLWTLEIFEMCGIYETYRRHFGWSTLDVLERWNVQWFPNIPQHPGWLDKAFELIHYLYLCEHNVPSLIRYYENCEYAMRTRRASRWKSKSLFI